MCCCAKKKYLAQVKNWCRLQPSEQHTCTKNWCRLQPSEPSEQRRRSHSSSRTIWERAEVVYSSRSMLLKISVPRSSSPFLDPSFREQRWLNHFTGRALPVLTLIDTPPATGITLHRCCTLHTCDQSNNLICLSAACKNNQGQLVGDK
jgi:hypothetical protein